MKSLTSYLLIAALSLTAISAHGERRPVRSKSNISNNKEAATPTPTPAPPKTIQVTLKCLACNPPYTGIQTASRNADGSYSVELPAAGKYTISYASGPNKDTVITTVTATKAEKTSIQAQINGMK